MDAADGNRRGRFAEIRWLAETGSTNGDALDAAAAGAPEGLVVVADHQRDGRGRLGRAWIAPSGASLLVSVLLRPTLGPDDLFLLTLAAGIAAIEAVEATAGVTVGLKWPNDLVVLDGPSVDRKVAGILAESHVEGGAVTAVVIGMGLNVAWPAELPAEIAATATSLDRLAPAVSREVLLDEWLAALDRWLTRLDDGERDALLAVVRSRSATVGRRVRVERSDGSIEGVATGIELDGALLVATDEGRSESVRVGDVVHVRAVG